MGDAEGFQTHCLTQDHAMAPLTLPFISLGMPKGDLPLSSRECVYCPLLHSCLLVVIVLYWISLFLGLSLYERQLLLFLLNSASKSAREITVKFHYHQFTRFTKLLWTELVHHAPLLD